MKCLKYWSSKEEWAKAEEKFWLHKTILGYFVEDLSVKEKTQEVALSIIQRHNLLKDGYIKNKEALAAIQPYFVEGCDRKSFVEQPNGLFTKDAFAPTEETLGISERGNFINLLDYQLELDKSVLWIEDINSEKFLLSQKELKKARLIGFDVQYKTNFANLGSPGIAVLQLATPEFVFVFDCLKLSGKVGFGSLLIDVLGDPAIIIIGDALLGKLRELKGSVLLEPKGELEVQSYCDIQAVFQDLNQLIKKPDLTTVFEKTLGKRWSSFEEISNWSLRPLRLSQIHFSAARAFLLVKLYETFSLAYEKKKNGHKIESYIIEKILVKEGIHGTIQTVGQSFQAEESKFANSKEESKSQQDEAPMLPGIFGNFFNSEVLPSTKKKVEDKNSGKKQKKENLKVNVSKKETKSNQQEKEQKCGEDGVEKETDSKVSYQEKPGEFTFLPKYKHVFSDPNNIKFVIDNMAIRLAKYLRSYGLDAEVQAEKDTDSLFETAKTENRVIITRDQKTFCKRGGWPIYLLHKTNTEQQLLELLEFFKIDRTKKDLLLRCVKCNSNEMTTVGIETVKPLLEWQNEKDYELYKPFWQCTKCKKVYWKGQTDRKSQQQRLDDSKAAS